MAETAAVPKTSQRTRFKWLVIAGGTFVVAGLFYAAYWFVALRHFERTDDAYVQGNLVQITPQVPGTVVSVGADDTDYVKAGTALVTLDHADAEVALGAGDLVRAQLPANTEGAFDLSVVNGNVRSDFPLSQVSKAHIGRHLQGQIGSSTRVVKMHSVNGSVLVTTRPSTPSHE